MNSWGGRLLGGSVIHALMFTVFMLFMPGSLEAASPPILIKDIAQGATSEGSFPEYFVRVGNKVYFSVASYAYGREVFVTDGTPEGTQIFADLLPGPGRMSNLYLYPFEGQLVVEADSFSDPSIYLLSDGTSSGTQEISNSHPAIQFGSESHGKIGTHYIFSDYDQATGFELYSSDGVTKTLLKEFQPGSTSSYPLSFKTLGNLVYFTMEAGYPLYVTDGTEAGTLPLKNNGSNVTVGGNGSFGYISSFGIYNNEIYFFGSGVDGSGLWATGGTDATTRRIRDLGSATAITGYAVSGGKLFFVTDDESNQLWVTNGTEGGTTLLETFAEAWNGLGLAAVNGKAFIAARDDTYGTELWVSDGTAGNASVIDILPGPGDSYPRDLTALNNEVVFSASIDASFNRGLWKTDGTPQGTQQVKDICISPNSSNPIPIASASNDAFFRTYESDNMLYKTNGTALGTEAMTDIPQSTRIEASIMFGSQVFFNKYTPTQGEELWVSNGNAGAGTHIVSDLTPGTGGTFPAKLTLVGQRLLFQYGSHIGNAPTPLWAVDAINPGVPEVLKANVGIMGGFAAPQRDPVTLTVFNGRAYFCTQAENGSGEIDLWATDGTAAGTQVVKRLHDQSSGAGMALIKAGNRLFVLLRTTSSGVNQGEIWMSNGSAAGTTLVKTLSDFSMVGAGSAGNDLILIASENSEHELWASDGTDAGTQRIVQAFGGVQALFLSFGNAQAFNALSVGGKYYFATNEDAVWCSDGTPEGTGLIEDFGYFDNQIHNFTPFHGLALFTVRDTFGNEQVYAAGGSSNGVQLLGPGHSSGEGFTSIAAMQVWKNRLLMSADDGITGYEPYRMTLASSSAIQTVPTGNSPPQTYGPTGVRLDFAANSASGSVETNYFDFAPGNLPLSAHEHWSIEGLSGNIFEANVRLTYNEGALAAGGLDEDAIALYRSEDDAETWTWVPATIDASNNTIETLEDTHHFSLWAIAAAPPNGVSEWMLYSD